MAGLGRFCLSDVCVLLVSGAMCWGVRFLWLKARFPKKGRFWVLALFYSNPGVISEGKKICKGWA